MSVPVLIERLRGPFRFLDPRDHQLQALLPGYEHLLPSPRPIFLESEQPTSMYALFVLHTEGLESLRAALIAAVEAETVAQEARQLHSSFDVQHCQETWDVYLGYLARASGNVAASAYGSDLQSAFWLYHSVEVARLLRETPRRVLRRTPKVGRKGASEIKYRVLAAYFDRLEKLLRLGAVAAASEDPGGRIERGPHLLGEMKKNVLIFTEEHIGSSLEELQWFFEGSLGEGAGGFPSRWRRLRSWLGHELETNRGLREMATFVNGGVEERDPDRLLNRRGFLAYLRTTSFDYSSTRLRDDDVELWEALLPRLKLFELLNELRGSILTTRRQQGHLVCEAAEIRRLGGGDEDITLSEGTRPFDFMSPWIVDPSVERTGLMYDLTGFSGLLAAASTDSATEKETFRELFKVQRHFDSIASDHRLYIEKYLGDGAFYTGRDPRLISVAAIRLQRAYCKAVEEGFSINKGIRIGLNYGKYRLLPLQGTGSPEGDRYEVFGHSMVELSRLTSGKAKQDLEETKLMLMASGYLENTIDEFFKPLRRDQTDSFEALPQDRTFLANVNRAGQLFNEGIVTTTEFLVRLEELLGEVTLVHLSEHGRSYVVVQIEDAAGTADVGFRRLGTANLKGLNPMPVYEIVDTLQIPNSKAERMKTRSLMAAIDQLFSVAVTSAAASG